jgi:O-antigen ligase
MKPLHIKYLYWSFAAFSCCLLSAIALQKFILITIPFALLITYLALHNLKAIWFLLIAAIPFSYELQLSSAFGMDMPDEPLMLLITGVFFLMLLTKSIQIQKHFLFHPVSICIFLIFIWSIVTASFSTIPFFSFKYVLAKVWFIVPFVIMPWFFLHQKKQFIKFAIVLLVSVLTTIIFILFKHFPSRFTFDNINNAVAPFYRNHVNYAALLVCCIPLIILLYTHTLVVKYKYYLIGILAIFLFALATSYSRGAWLALMAGVVSIYFIKKRLAAISFLLCIAIAISSFFVLFKNNQYLLYHPNYKKTIYHGNFNDHINATFAGTDMSNAERINRWIAGVHMLDGNLLVGYGPNTFYHNYKPYMVTYFKTWVSDNPEKSTIHNYLLLTLIEQGIIGFLLLISLIYYTYYSLQKAYKYETDGFFKNVILCIASIFTMCIVLNMLSDLVETDKIGSVFYLCIGLTVLMANRQHIKIKLA